MEGIVALKRIEFSVVADTAPIAIDDDDDVPPPPPSPLLLLIFVPFIILLLLLLLFIPFVSSCLLFLFSNVTDVTLFEFIIGFVFGAGTLLYSVVKSVAV